MKQGEVSLERVTKTVEALKAMQRLIHLGNYTSGDFQQIAKKHGVSVTLFYTALRLGVFKSRERGVYEINIEHIDPIHARECILDENKARAEYYAKQIKKENPLPAPLNARKSTQAVTPVPPPSGNNDDFKTVYIDSIVERFRRSLVNRNAKELKEINDKMMEIGII